MAKQFNTKNNEELLVIRTQDNLSRPLIARICGVSKSLVDCWLSPPHSPLFRVMSDRDLRLLKLETGRAEPAYLDVRETAAKLKRQIKGGA